MAFTILGCLFAIVNFSILLSGARKNEHGYISAARFSVAVGLVHFFLTAWIYEALPFGIMEPRYEVFGAIILQCILVLPLIAISYLCIHLIQRYTTILQGKNAPLMYTLLMCGVELMYVTYTSLMFAGEQTGVYPHLINQATGAILTFTPFVALARFGGIFTLTFILYGLIFIINTYGWRNKLVHKVLLSISIITGILISSSSFHARNTIYLTHTNFPDFTQSALRDTHYNTEVAARRQALMRTLATFATTSEILLIFPEDTRFISLATASDPTHTFVLQNFPSTTIIDGSTFTLDTQRSTQFLAFTPLLTSATHRGKLGLFPISEYIPYSLLTLTGALAGSSTLRTFLQVNQARRGEEPILTETSHMSAVIFMCSEIFSYITRQYVEKLRPDVIIIQTNLAFLQGRPYGAFVYANLARLVAAENNTAALMSSNKAPSMVISPAGSVLYYGYDAVHAIPRE